MKKDLTNKALAVAGAVGIAALTVGAGIGYFIQPEPVVKYVTETVEVPVEVPVEVVKTVEVPVEVEKVVVKNVTDTELIKATCDRLLFDDIAECQKEVKAEDKAIELAWKKLEKELSNDDFLEDELKNGGFITDEDEVRVVKLYKDFKDIEIVKSDYDDDEYEFVLKVKLDDEEADVKKKLLFNVTVSDGEAEVTDISEE